MCDFLRSEMKAQGVFLAVNAKEVLTHSLTFSHIFSVNVRIELAGDPCVLLLDEPTSGLDASASKAICESLRKLADIGLTIIAVIHQPRYEIFTLYK